MKITKSAWLLSSLVVLLSGAVVWAQPNPGKSKVKVEFVPSVEAVVPGKPFELAISLKVQENWHVYWKHPGEAGQPTSVKWHAAPVGFSIGDLQFPIPKRHKDAGGLITTNILEEDATFLISVTPPNSIKEDKVSFKGKLSYLVCEVNCLPGFEDLNLEIPVQKEGEPKPLHKKLFDEARRQQPLKTSKHLKVTPRLAPETPAEPQSLMLQFDVPIGFKIQSNAPLQSEFIATDVFTLGTPGMIFKPAEYPEPRIKEMPGLGKVAEFSGKFDVRVPIELTGEPMTCPVLFAGVVEFQACDTKGICSTPESLEYSLSLPCTQVNGAGGHGEPPSNTATAPTPSQPPSTGSAGAQSGSAPSTPPKTSSSSAPPETWVQRMLHSTWGVLFLAFLGGLILNVMPCVLPVISIKVLSFVQQADESPGRVFRLGLTFAAGIIISFWALALVIIGLKSAGNTLGWGFQQQSPHFTLIMVAIVFLFGLSLFGVFQITLPGAAFTKLSAAEEREGYAGAFTKGLLGTVLATPCTAPFLGPALGVAFKSESGVLFAIFTSVGLGMSFPFLLLTMNPGWLKLMPKPGAWMETFKQLMGFLLMGTVVWLLYPMGGLVGADGLIWCSVFIVFVALAAWVLGRISPLSSSRRRAALWLMALAVVVFGWWFSFNGTHSLHALKDDANPPHPPLQIDPRKMDCGHLAGQLPPGPWKQIPWVHWHKGLPERLANCGYTVYVDFTAKWCATCLANKRAFLETDAVRQKMLDGCVIPIKADFTQENAEMLEVIQSFGRAGVPLNVIYPANAPENAIVMPEILGSTAFVNEKLDEAGKSTMSCPSPGAELTAPPGSAVGKAP